MVRSKRLMLITLACALLLAMTGCSTSKKPPEQPKPVAVQKKAKPKPPITWESEGQGGSDKVTDYITATGEEYLCSDHALWLLKGAKVTLVHTWADEDVVDAWPALDGGLYVQTKQRLWFADGKTVVKVSPEAHAPKSPKKTTTGLTPRERYVWQRYRDECYMTAFYWRELTKAHDEGYTYSWETEEDQSQYEGG